MLTLPSLSSSSAEARLMSLLSGMCLICFMALMSSLTLMTVSLQGQPACGTAGPRPPPGLPRAGPPASGARAPRGQRGSTTWSAVVCDGPSRGCCAAGCEDGALGQCAVLLADQGGRAGEPTQRVSPGGVLTSSGGEGPATWGQQSLAPRVPSVGCDRLAGGFTPLQLPLASQAPGVRQGRDGPHTGATTEYLVCVRVQGKGGGGRGPNNVRGAELRVAEAGGREVWQAEGGHGLPGAL